MTKYNYVNELTNVFCIILQINALGANYDIPGFLDRTNINGLAADNTICFKSTSVMADLAPIIDKTRSISFELYVKTCAAASCHGVIFSYAVKKTFAVWHQGTVVITYDTFRWDTGLELEDDKWNQISVIWTNSEKKLEVYVFNSQGSIIGRAEPEETLPTPNPFKFGGKMTLGGWQTASQESAQYINDKFRGCLDELRIWRRLVYHHVTFSIKLTLCLLQKMHLKISSAEVVCCM